MLNMNKPKKKNSNQKKNTYEITDKFNQTLDLQKKINTIKEDKEKPTKTNVIS